MLLREALAVRVLVWPADVVCARCLLRGFESCSFIVLDKGIGADGKVCALLPFASILAFGISSGSPSLAIAIIFSGRRLAEGALLRRWDHPCAFFAFSLAALLSTSYPQFDTQLKMGFREIGVFVAQPVVC